jgi:hypothetical protein
VSRIIDRIEQNAPAPFFEIVVGDDTAAQYDDQPRNRHPTVAVVIDG